MSNTLLMVLILVFVFGGILIFGVIFSFVKRNQYLKDVQGKIKCVFFPQAGATYSQVVDVRLSGHEIAAPKDHHLPRYFFNKENTWQTRYPDNPFLGLTFLQVQIATVWYYEDNPEPITSQAIIEPQVATSSMIFASIDSAFALVVHELDAELQKTKKQLLEALASKINKNVVYVSLFIIVLCVVIGDFLIFKNGSNITKIMNTLGVVK
jgi:hypothetical protein